MKPDRYDAIGIAEVSFFANAVYILDEMVKAADVQFLKAEKRLGGRLVTLIVGGSTAEVTTAIERAKRAGETMDKNPLKMGITISNPHPEILKFVQ